MKAVRITALWCMSCLVMRNRYDKLFSALEIDEVIELDYDQDDLTGYDVGEILPVVFIYNDEKEVLKIVGEHSKKQLKKLFDKIQ